MKRLALNALNEWKNRSKRKPLLIDGPRQCGKTYLVREIFGPTSFKNVHVVDFRRDKDAHAFFEGSINPEDILSNLSIYLNHKIDLENDLIFFDEIGECQGAIDSLKYFCDSYPEAYLCSSGSNIGLLSSFPVGKIETVNMRPMSFYEFILASGEDLLIEAYSQRSRALAVHDKLWDKLLDYYFVGGMPESVAAWFDADVDDKLTKIKSVEKIQTDLLEGYYRDFGKYSGRINAMHIETVFRNIPVQLSKNIEGSSGRYKFKGVIPKKERYLDLLGPIEWLCKSKLASKCNLVDSKPRSPLKAVARENLFKIYMFDIGILGRMLDLTYEEQRAQKIIEKGYLAENFVINELIASGNTDNYYWSENTSEIEFLIKSKSGEIYPVEVKSGKRTQTKSLKVFMEKYSPAKSVKLVGKAGGFDDNQVVWPLYYAQNILDL